MPKKVTGISKAHVMSDGSEIHFKLDRPNGDTFDLVATPASAMQITAALAHLTREAQKMASGPAPMAAERVVGFAVTRDQVGNSIALQLQSEHGVRYTFAMPPQIAADIAAWLKTESGSAPTVGNA